MMSGEFKSMTTIHDVMPELVPNPIAWGTYSTLKDVHFFLCAFRNMTDELPDIESFPAQMAELHRLGTSPNGKFGFYIPTYHGNTPIEHGWSDSWEDYFTRTTRVLMQMEQESQGPNQEILDLFVPFFEKVIPRLLRPLETGNRSIKPSLIHGDLWHGNASMDGDTDGPVIFDAACFYAHNECESVLSTASARLHAQMTNSKMSWAFGGSLGIRSRNLIGRGTANISLGRSQKRISRTATRYMLRG